MDSRSLYRKLELDFNLKDMKDDWSFMSLDNDFIFPEFKSRYMGLVADNTEQIRKVYTATFPDRDGGLRQRQSGRKCSCTVEKHKAKQG